MTTISDCIAVNHRQQHEIDFGEMKHIKWTQLRVAIRIRSTSIMCDCFILVFSEENIGFSILSCRLLRFIYGKITTCKRGKSIYWAVSYLPHSLPVSKVSQWKKSMQGNKQNDHSLRMRKLLKRLKCVIQRSEQF